MIEPIRVTPFSLAQRFVGVRELPGAKDNPFIMAMLTLDQSWPGHDEVAWCSGFANWIAWILRLPRSKSLSARSWLGVGHAVQLRDAEVGFDVVVLKRGTGDQPGPEVLAAPGHVGFYAGRDGSSVLVLGGNQGNAVSIARFPQDLVLGVQRLT